MTSPHHAVIFDLDGTLLDTLQDIADATNHTLALHGFPTHSRVRIAEFVGEGLKALLWRSLPVEDRNDDILQRCLATFRPYYRDHIERHTRPYDGIPELLDGLTERGVKLAVLSNKPESPTRTLVAALLGRWEFVAVEGGRADAPKKPDPTVALQLAQRLDLPPAQIAFVGDTAIDMQTAVVAGMTPVGVAWGFRPHELRTAGATQIVDYPTDLLETFWPMAS